MTDHLAEPAVTFTLKETATDYAGGILAVNGSDFDVAAALEEGDGSIVTTDPFLIVALDEYPVLERLAPVDVDTADYKALQARAKALDLKATGTRDELEERIAKHEDELAALAEAELASQSDPAPDTDTDLAGDGADN